MAYFLLWESCAQGILEEKWILCSDFLTDAQSYRACPKMERLVVSLEF